MGGRRARGVWRSGLELAGVVTGVARRRRESLIAVGGEEEKSNELGLVRA